MSSVVVEAARSRRRGRAGPPRRPGRRRPPRRPASARNASSDGSGAPVSERVAAARLEVAVGQPGRELAAGRRGRRRSRRPAAARPGARASTSGHAASSSSTPLEPISLPTNTTSRSPVEVDGRERGGGLLGREGERGAGGTCRASRREACGSAAATRSRSAARPAAAIAGSRGDEVRDVDAGRAEPRAVGQRSGRPSRPTGSRRCGASPTSTARARREPLDRVGLEARVRLDGVLERGAVDLDHVGDVQARRAPGRGSPGP